MSAGVYGGVDIAMNDPAHQYESTIALYRDVVGLKPITDKAPAVGFELGTDSFDQAAQHLAKSGVVRCGRDLAAACSPASIVHMVREPNAW